MQEIHNISLQIFLIVLI